MRRALVLRDGIRSKDRCGVIEDESQQLVDGHDVIGGWCRCPARGDARDIEVRPL
jgi:hypothetical protein